MSTVQTALRRAYLVQMANTVGVENFSAVDNFNLGMMDKIAAELQTRAGSVQSVIESLPPEAFKPAPKTDIGAHEPGVHSSQDFDAVSKEAPPPAPEPTFSGGVPGATDFDGPKPVETFGVRPR